MSPREGVEGREGGAVERARMRVSGERQGGEEAEEEGRGGAEGPGAGGGGGQEAGQGTEGEKKGP